MKLIVGLGNPGIKYANHLHNAGFIVLDQLADRLNVVNFKEKFNAIYAKSSQNGEDFILMKPMTFMNNSGEAVSACMKFFKISFQNLVVIFDDLDLEVGKVRFRLNGGHGGHNGMRSIIQYLGTNDFKRVRLGISRPPERMSVSNYVLSNWKEEELTKLNHIEDGILEYLIRFIKDSVFENTSLQHFEV